MKMASFALACLIFGIGVIGATAQETAPIPQVAEGFKHIDDFTEADGEYMDRYSPQQGDCFFNGVFSAMIAQELPDLSFKLGEDTIVLQSITQPQAKITCFKDRQVLTNGKETVIQSYDEVFPRKPTPENPESAKPTPDTET